jgi:hypothetical protein
MGYMAVELRKYGAGAGTRTRNRPITSRVRCQLRHAGGVFRSYLGSLSGPIPVGPPEGGSMASPVSDTWAYADRSSRCS